jgi:hypothetical protein
MEMVPGKLFLIDKRFHAILPRAAGMRQSLKKADASLKIRNPKHEIRNKF